MGCDTMPKPMSEETAKALSDKMKTMSELDKAAERFNKVLFDCYNSLPWYKKLLYKWQMFKYKIMYNH